MTSDNESWRIRVGLNMTKEIDNTDVPDANDPNNTVTDKNSVGKTDINLYLGKEFRKGKARLQGVYGAEAGLLFHQKRKKMNLVILQVMEELELLKINLD